MVADEVEHVGLVDDLLVDTRLQIVVDKLRGDALDRLFARRVYLRQHHLVELTQCVGKVAVEVACAGVEMRLEDSRDMSALIEFTDAARALVDFLRVVGIVAEEYQLVGLDLEVETAVDATIGLHTVAQIFGCASVELCHSHGSDAILYVDRYGLSQFDIGHRLYRRHEVEGDGAVPDTDILGMEVAFIQRIVIAAHTLGKVFLHL